MKLSLLKLFVVCVAVFTFASVSFGQKKLSQRCPGSATKAEISISKQGDIAITKCTGRTLTIDGAAAPLRYITRIYQYGTSAPIVPNDTGLYINTLGTSITSTSRADIGEYSFTFSGGGIPFGRRLVRMSNTDPLVFCSLESAAANIINIYCVDPATGNAKDIDGDPDRFMYLDIEVFPL